MTAKRRRRNEADFAPGVARRAQAGSKGLRMAGTSQARGGGQERAQDSGEEVGVLVRVDVGDAEAGVLQAADLSGGFGGDFRGADAEGEEIADEAQRGKAERTGRWGRGWGFVREGGRGFRRRGGCGSRLRGVGLAWARAAASSKKAPVAMRVAEESAWARWSSAMERLTPGVRPKSSALTRRGTENSVAEKRSAKKRFAMERSAKSG